MLEYQTRPRTGLDATFRNMNNTVKQEIDGFANSGQFYVSPEIDRELRHINNGIDHIRLDHQLLNTSPGWGERWDPHRTAAELQGATQAMHGTAATIKSLQNTLGIRDVSKRQDNQVREDHHHAINDLRVTEQDLAPFAHQSTDRIKQFCDHVGVTDRYTGYRNNLSKNRRDSSGFASAPEVRRACDPRLTVSASGPLIKRQGNMTANSITKGTAQMSTSIQEQCGINTVFPGNTEYMVRYVAPPVDPKSVPFTINPQPNTAALGRPQMRTQWEPRITEYQRRYEFPDSEKITKLPWLKKF